MIKVYDDNDNIVVDDVHNAEMISAYLTNFKVDNKRYISDFNRICLEVASRILWRYAKYGFSRSCYSPNDMKNSKI